MHNSAQLRCFENGNDDVGVEAFWIGDAARVGYFVPLNGPLNGYPPSIYTTIGELSSKFEECLAVRSQFDSDHDQIWQACADRSGNGSYLNKLAP